MKTVIGLGSGSDADDRTTVATDIRPTDGIDVQFDALETWPFEDSGADGIVARHVLEHFTREEIGHILEEAARVLRPGGWVEICVPLGANYRTDTDHENPWTWNTPETFSQAHRRGWDLDVPFTLTDRDVRAWAVKPFGFVTPLFRATQRLCGDGLWSTEAAHAPMMAGELTATYELHT